MTTKGPTGQVQPELLDAIRDMRRLQRAWFGGDKSNKTFVEARRAEVLVDRLVAEHDSRQVKMF